MNQEKVKQSGRIKMALCYFYNSLCIPALVVHEFLHYIFIKLTFAKYMRTSITLGDDYEKTGRLSVGVFYVPDNKFQIFLISMAPFLALFIWTIPFALGYTTLALISIIYTLMCIGVIIPSKGDFDAVRGKQEYV